MNKKTFNSKTIGLLLGLISAIIIYFFTDLEPGKPEITATMSVAVLMAIWWVSEAIPIAITALLPVVLFPLLGIMNGKTISSAYFNHVIFLFIGGFLMALAMEKHNLHKRIALRILLFTGSGYGKILLGFMIATSFLSMWMSNTATAMMMVPVVISIVNKFKETLSQNELNKYASGLLFGVAYSASVGGIATLIGTPPNLSFVRIFSIIFPNAPEITFSQWFIFAIPITISMLIASWIVLYFIYKPKIKKNKEEIIIFREQYKNLGRASYEEKIVFLAFISLALLWIFRSGIIIGNFEIPGWSALFNNPKFINDGTVAIAIALLLFIIPTKTNSNSRILEGKILTKLPWHIVLLFGGGFALAQGFADSGLAIWLGNKMTIASIFHPFIIILLITFFMSFLTELTSNTATTEMILPILAGIAVSIELNPLIFMIPATIAASLAFMLPVATPPNAIIFGTNRLRISQMMKTGFILNFIGIIIVTLVMYFWGQTIFDIDVLTFPEWAKTLK
ncbi:MAG: DASS family sodium-coupled anion symporter [Bacteroidales bacterium]|nr:DASS family sodium-coupled anion symporter [Bacteroidales bacterium]MBN2758060.1 DASS family sodium-coupled anion symporter [Bacteroidales bacterium]